MVLQHRQATYHSILDALAGLEPAGAAMAATRHRESDIATLRAAADRFDPNSGVETRKAFFQFDYALGEATHDDVFNVVWTAVVQLSSVPQLRIPEHISTGLAAGHHEIVDAVEIGDSDAARGLMLIHRKELADWLRVRLCRAARLADPLGGRGRTARAVAGRVLSQIERRPVGRRSDPGWVDLDPQA